MPTTLLFGGTFDPIHFGHLITARSAAEILHAAQVIFIPANINPLKRTKATAPDGGGGKAVFEGGQPGLAGGDRGVSGVSQGGLGGGHARLEMLKLAIRGHALFAVEDLEILRPPPSYTIDTVETLLPKYGPDITLLIGADQLAHFHHWHRVRDLLEKVRIAILGRPGAALDSGLELIRNHLGEPVFQQFQKSILPTPLIEISATDIRNRCQKGLPIDLFTPAPVVEYIRAHQLYV